VPTAALVAFASPVATVLGLPLPVLVAASLAALTTGSPLPVPVDAPRLARPILVPVLVPALLSARSLPIAVRFLPVLAALLAARVPSSVALTALPLLPGLPVSPAAAFRPTGFAPVLEVAPFARVRFEAAALTSPLVLPFGSSILPPVGLSLGSSPFVPVRLPLSSLAAITPLAGLLPPAPPSAALAVAAGGRLGAASPALAGGRVPVAFRPSSLPSAVFRPLCAAVLASAAAEQPVEPAPVAALAVVPAAIRASVGFARAVGAVFVAVSVGGVSVVHGVVVGGRRFGPIDAPVAGGLGTAVEVGRTRP
jgi:hypothetical protein